MSPNDETEDWYDLVFAPVLSQLQRVLPMCDIRLSPTQHVILAEAKSSKIIIERDIAAVLDHLFAAKHNPQRAEALMARLVDDLRRTIDAMDVLPEHPYPVLRTSTFVEAYGSEALSGNGVGDCKSVLMRQREGAPPEILTMAQAMKAGLTSDALWAAAQRNLRTLANTLVLQEYDYGVMSIELEGHDWLGGSLLQSRTVLRKALERLNIQTAFVCAPSQISVDLIDANAPDALPRISKWMAERLAEERPLSELVFEFDRDKGQLTPRYASRGGQLIGPV